MVSFSNNSIKYSNGLGLRSQPRIRRICRVFSVFGHGFSVFGHNFSQTRPIFHHSALNPKFFNLQQNSNSTMDAPKITDEIILNASGSDKHSIKISKDSTMDIVSNVQTHEPHLTLLHVFQSVLMVIAPNTHQGLPMVGSFTSFTKSDISATLELLKIRKMTNQIAGKCSIRPSLVDAFHKPIFRQSISLVNRNPNVLLINALGAAENTGLAQSQTSRNGEWRGVPHSQKKAKLVKTKDAGAIYKLIYSRSKPKLVVSHSLPTARSNEQSPSNLPSPA
jgi:hypothetical protein